MRKFAFLMTCLLTAAAPVAAQSSQSAAGKTDESSSVRGDRSASGSDYGSDRAAMREEQIKNNISSRLARSASLEGSDIDVSVDDRTAHLEGVVRAEQDKERAEQLARRVSGVREVENDIRVDEEAVAGRMDQEVTDQELAQRVAHHLADEVFTAADVEEQWLYGWELEGYNWELEVEADGRTIILEGTVPERSDIYRAIASARDVKGVRSVDGGGLHTESRLYDPYDGWGGWTLYPYPY